jgi:zinc transporter
VAVIEDHSGLICGFEIEPDGRVERIAWDRMDAAMKQPAGIVWLHLNLTDQRVQNWILNSASIPRGAAEILIGSDRHMRLEPVGDGLVGVLGDLHHEFDNDTSAVGVLRLYLRDRLLITARREPLRAIDRLRRAVLDEELRVTGSADLVVHLLDHLSTTLGGVIAELIEAVDEVEDNLLADRSSNEAGELGRVRRVVAQLRRHIVPQRQALAGVLAKLPPWLTPDEASSLRLSTERLAAVGHDLDFVAERAMLLQNELSGRLAENTNRNLYFLSIVTAIFLPMTLITGIFGMNVGGVPGVGDGYDNAFFWVMVGMAATGMAAILLLRWRKLL